jgi:intracellular sulfur oxidation DsrE/DsrF family protein
VWAVPSAPDVGFFLWRLQMTLRIASLAMLLAISASLFADEPSLGPVIEGYGPTFPIDDRDVPLIEGAVYKAVFDVATYSDDTTKINNRLISVARYLNMHGRNGVPVENMDLAIVVHGRAVKNLLSNEAYQTRYGSDNPNLELLMKLSDVGVDIYLCGQSMSFGGVHKVELASPAKVALSAMTMLTVLQSEGFALLN